MAVTLIDLGLDISAQNMTGLAVDQDGDFLYGCTGIGEIYKWDITDNSITSGRTTWTTVATLLGGIATDTNNIYVLSEAQYVRKSSLSSPSFSILATADSGSGDVWQSMTFGNDKLYVGGHRNTGANHILRVWEIDTTTGAQTVITEMDVTTTVNASNSYTDVYVASDGAIWAPKPFDKIYRGEPGVSGPLAITASPTVPGFKGDLLPSISGGNFLYFYNAGGANARTISPSGVFAAIVLNLSISKPNVSSAVTNDISVKRVIGFTDGNGAQLHCYVVNETEPTMFSLSRTSRRNSLLTYPCTYGDGSTAFHYGTALFPNDEEVFSTPNEYTYNWSTQLGGTNRVLTVYSDGSDVWAQVLDVAPNGDIDWGEPKEVTFALSNPEEAWLVSLDQDTAVFVFNNDSADLAVAVFKTRSGGFDPSVARRDSSYSANRLRAIGMNSEWAIAAVTDDLTLGVYPVNVIPIHISYTSGEGFAELSQAQELAYRNWMTANGFTEEEGYNVDDSFNGLDYDYRGYFLEFGNVILGIGEHLTDTYKLPNHETFSDESQYAVGDYAQYAGTWAGEVFTPAATIYTGDYHDLVNDFNLNVDFSTPTKIGESGNAFIYAPHITKMSNTRFLVRWPSGAASTKFRHAAWVGSTVALAPSDQNFAWNSKDYFLLGVSASRALNGSDEGGELKVRVIDIGTNNAITTATPFHSETDDLPTNDYSVMTRATDRTVLMGWTVETGTRVCHIQFPIAGDLRTSEDETRIYQRDRV